MRGVRGIWSLSSGEGARESEGLSDLGIACEYAVRWWLRDSSAREHKLLWFGASLWSLYLNPKPQILVPLFVPMRYSRNPKP